MRLSILYTKSMKQIRSIKMECTKPKKEKKEANPFIFIPKPERLEN